MQFQKIKNYRSEKYKKFVRSKSCLSCDSTEGVQAAHVSFKNSGMGMKAPDTQCLPLCGRDSCHPREHREGYRFWDSINIDPKVEIVKLLTEYIRINI